MMNADRQDQRENQDMEASRVIALNTVPIFSEGQTKLKIDSRSKAFNRGKEAWDASLREVICHTLPGISQERSPIAEGYFPVGSVMPHAWISSINRFLL